MFTWVSRRLRSRDDGFTLIEVVVALVIFGFVAAALTPVLVSALRASRFAQMNTIAKNLAQQRIDAMRALPYHVDAQNGPYVDLLDLYYHDTSGAVSSIQHVVAGSTVTGQYSSVGGGTGPSGPYYKVSIAGSAIGSTYTPFTETVYSQFLVATNPAATPMSASSLPSSYNNSTVGADAPPSLLLGVTVVVNWQQNGLAKSFRTFTEMTDNGNASPLITSQARSDAIDITSKDEAGNTLTVQIGVVDTSGTLSNGSSAGASAEGAVIESANGTQVTGASAQTESPPNVGTSQNTSVGGQTTPGANCGWASFGPTAVSNVGSTTAGGLPLAPLTADPNTGSAVSATLQANGSNSCGGVNFSNSISGTPAIDLPGYDGTSAMVRVADTSGNGSIVTGSSYIYSNNQTGSVGAVQAKASMTSSTWVKFFKGLSFLPGSAPDVTGSPGIFNVQVTSASLNCTSGGNPTLTYTLEVVYYNPSVSGGWSKIGPTTVSVSGTGTTSDPLASVNLATDQVTTDGSGNPVYLSRYIASATGAKSITGSGGTSNTAPSNTVQGVVSVGTAATRSTDPLSTIGVNIGHLSCVAQDNR